MGDMADDAAWAAFDSGDEDAWEPVRKPLTCWYCGESGFYWTPTPAGWRLGRGGRVHDCLGYFIEAGYAPEDRESHIQRLGKENKELQQQVERLRKRVGELEIKFTTVCGKKED